MTRTVAAGRALQAPAWWRDAVVYQIYPRSFADSDGDGIGDLQGIIAHLDHLVTLGVDVVWLSPIYASPQADNGYDISDYRAIDPVFGSLDDFDELVEAMHARGLRLVMDLVVNHTSDEHPWFVESASGPDSAKRDWYWWRPARPGTQPGSPGAEPNNWGAVFSGPAWTFDPASREYYLHLFAGKQPDLNWENPAVRHAIHDIMRWWLDRGVDGFRMDVINYISKVPELPDAPSRPGEMLADGQAFYNCGPRLHEYLQEMHREVFADRPEHVLTIGEMPGVDLANALLATDPARRELDMVFQFEHVSLDHGTGGKWQRRRLEPDDLAATFERWQHGLAGRGWNSLYWNNHDQPRVVSRFGNDGQYWRESATALAAVLHLQQGTPFIYQGEELGMTNLPFREVGQLRDIESVNHYATALAAGVDEATAFEQVRWAGRDNARTPFQWDAGPRAGFSTGRPWIDVNPNHGWLNAAAQVGVGGSVFEFYRQLIALRHSDPVIVDGDFERLPGTAPGVLAYRRVLGDQQLTVIANLSDSPCRPGTDIPQGSLLLRNVTGLLTDTLAPWELRVFRS